MGEEPERLRARIERAREKHWMHIELPMREADALLAEVERLARDNEQHIQTIKEGRAGEHGLMAEVVALNSQVERLAGERDEAIKQRDKWKAECSVLFEDWEKSANECERLCERLAGRMAAAEDLIDRALGTVERAGWTGGKWHRDARAFRDHKRMEV